ncbi:hypothetical protein U1Q18_039081 [Sarracenia purpurea var. burkii]
MRCAGSLLCCGCADPLAGLPLAAVGSLLLLLACCGYGWLLPFSVCFLDYHLGMWFCSVSCCLCCFGDVEVLLLLLPFGAVPSLGGLLVVGDVLVAVCAAFGLPICFAVLLFCAIVVSRSVPSCYFAKLLILLKSCCYP